MNGIALGVGVKNRMNNAIDTDEQQQVRVQNNRVRSHSVDLKETGIG